MRSEKKIVATLMDQKPKASGFYGTLIFFVLMTAVTVSSWHFQWQKILSANFENVFIEKQWWRLLFSIFLHSDPEHWLSNSLLLIIFGALLAGYFGFKLFPVYSVILAWITHALALWTYPKEVYLIGASGLVYVLSGLWLALYFAIARNRSLRGRFLRVLGVILALLLPTQFQPEVSYRAHLIGFIVGFVFGVLYYLKYKNYLQSFDILEEIVEEDPVEVV